MSSRPDASALAPPMKLIQCTHWYSMHHAQILGMAFPRIVFPQSRAQHKSEQAEESPWRSSGVWRRTNQTLCRKISSSRQGLSVHSPADPAPSVAWGSVVSAPSAADGVADRSAADTVNSLTWRSVSCQHAVFRRMVVNVLRELT